MLGAPSSGSIAWLGGPDRRTWEAVALSSDAELRLAPDDRRGARLAAWQRDWCAARYRRRRLLGGGRLEADDAPGLRLRPARMWGSREWRVMAGARRWATVESRPEDRLRLVWRWEADPAERSGLACVCACYAILVEDIVSTAVPPMSPSGP